MASQTQGIQQLLAAEKKAAEKVGEARKRKNRRLKQAKEEAQITVEKLKSEREKEFKDYEAKFLGSKNDIASRIETDTNRRINTINANVANHRADVIEALVKSCCDSIVPVVHSNYAACST